MGRKSTTAFETKLLAIAYMRLHPTAPAKKSKYKRWFMLALFSFSEKCAVFLAFYIIICYIKMDYVEHR